MVTSVQNQNKSEAESEVYIMHNLHSITERDLSYVAPFVTLAVPSLAIPRQFNICLLQVSNQP